MPSGNITISAVRALAAGQTIWDAGHREAVRGFGIRRQRGDPAYVIKYRVNGRQRFYTIDTSSRLTPDQARREAKRLLGLVAAGKDPVADKKHARLLEADTLGKLVNRYLVYAQEKQKPRSYLETKRHLLVAWKPLHPTSLNAIHRRDISARIAKLSEQSGPVAASHARAALSAMFNWAIREGREPPVNPVIGTNRPTQPKSRERVLTEAELAAIWRACDDDDYGRIVRLLILTGQRRDEVGGLRRDEIAGDVWSIPSDRTKNHREHRLPLSPQAKVLVGTALSETNRQFAFGRGPRSADGPHRGFSGWSKAKAELDARIHAKRTEMDPDAQPLPHWTVHDVRRTAATVMADRLGVLSSSSS